MTQKIRYALAADIGGTQMRAALVSSDGGVQARNSCDTEPQRGIEDAGHRLAEWAKVSGQPDQVTEFELLPAVTESGPAGG